MPEVSPLALLFVLGAGLCVGSFLNVLIYRLPLMMQREASIEHRCSDGDRFNLCWPRSHCTKCGTTLRWQELIPVLSWCLSKGKCRVCQQPIHWRYPLIEVVTAIITVIVVAIYPWGMTLPAVLLLSWGLFALAVIDLQTFLLPDKLTQPLLWLGLVGSLQGYLFVDIRASILGACTGYLSFWFLNKFMRLLLKKEAMGYGDFKLFAVLGAWFGWQLLPDIALLSAASAIVVTLIKNSVMKFANSTSEPVAFGPWLAMAGWIEIGWHSSVFLGYWW